MKQCSGASKTAITKHVTIGRIEILYEIDTENLDIRNPSYGPFLSYHYNNGYGGDEWIADKIPKENYKIISVTIGEDRLHEREEIPNIQNLQELQREINRIMEERETRLQHVIDKLSKMSSEDRIQKGEERILILKRLFKKDGLAYRELNTIDTSTDIGKLEFTMAQEYKNAPNNINYEKFKFYEERLKDLKSKENEEKSSWGIDASEKARIQTKSAEIAKNHRKQQEIQASKQPLQQQEDIKE